MNHIRSYRIHTQFKTSASKHGFMSNLMRIVFGLILLVMIMPFGKAYAQDINNSDMLALWPESISIDEAIEIALNQNRTLQSYGLNEQAAEQRIEEINASFGFNATITGNYMFVDDSSQLSLPLTYYDITPNDSGGFDINNPEPEIMFMNVDINTEYQHMGQLAITRPLYTFGAQEDASSIAGAGLDVARLDTELGRLTLIANVKKSFYIVILTENVVRLQRESVARAENHLFEVQELFNSGLSTRLDLLRSQTSVQSANEQLTTAITNNTLALGALNYLLGYEYEDQISVSREDAFRQIDIMPLENYISIALASRPELQQIDRYIEIANLQTRLNRDRPMIAFVGIWNFDSRGSLFVSQGSWRAMVTCEIPVFDSGLSQSRIDQVRTQEQDLELKKTDLINGIKIQTENAYLKLTEVQERLITSESILQTAEEGYRIATISYIENVATELDVMDAAHNLTGAGINLAQAQYDYEVALATLALACGLPDIE